VNVAGWIIIALIVLAVVGSIAGKRQDRRREEATHQRILAEAEERIDRQARYVAEATEATTAPDTRRVITDADSLGAAAISACNNGTGEYVWAARHSLWRETLEVAPSAYEAVRAAQAWLAARDAEARANAAIAHVEVKVVK